jgi:hypothetical protein
MLVSGGKIVLGKDFEDYSFLERVEIWLNGLEDNTGFGVFCSVRDNLLTDFSRATVNNIFGLSVLEPSNLAAVLFRNPEQTAALKARLGVYGLKSLQYLAVAAPLLFLGGFKWEGKLSAFKKYGDFLASNNPKDQEKFLAALEIESIKEGWVNIAFEVGSVGTALLGQVLHITKPVLKTLLPKASTAAGFGLMLLVNLIAEPIAEKHIADAHKEIDARYQTMYGLGLMPPTLSWDRTIQQYHSWQLDTTIRNDVMRFGAGAMMTHLGFKALRFLAGTNPVTVGLEIFSISLKGFRYIANDWEKAAFPEYLAQDMSPSVYGAFGKSRTIRDTSDLRWTTGTRPLQERLLSPLEIGRAHV